MTNSKSIAVLPFVNTGNNPDNDYFSDGLTEEIINALTKIPGLKVTARTSSFAFKNIHKDIREIGAALNVALILEGSIRTAKNNIRITTQLIRTTDGFTLWSETFNRQLVEIFELQDEISLLIADKIRENYGHLYVEEHLSNINTKNVQAYQHYLKGKEYYNHWNMPGFANAAREYEKSIAKDPMFDLPYFGAGLSYSFLGSWGTMDKTEAFERATRFFNSGNNLNIESYFRYYSIAKHLFWGLWQFNKAYDSLYKAYQMVPQDAATNEFMSEINALFGNFITAKKYIDTSLQINPLSATHYYTKAQILFLQNQHKEAIKVLEKGMLVAPTFSISHELHVSCAILLGDETKFTEALKNFNPDLAELFTAIYQMVNHRQDFNHELLQKAYAAKTTPLLAWDLYVLVQQNKLNEALHLLQKKVDNRMGQVLYLKYDPWLKPLHGHETFREIVRKISPQNSILTTTSTKSNSSKLTPEEANQYAGKLYALMETEKMYLDPKLGLKDLAKSVGLHPNKLSWLLNETINKNFYEFVNNYRLKDFQEKAVNENNKHLSILGLALESGFNSKSVFNDFFKKVVGQTPKDWLKQQ